MTERKPDIIPNWTIKQTDGIYTGRCVSLPNAEIIGKNPEDVCAKIQETLSSMYNDHAQIIGGITGFNTDYSCYQFEEGKFGD